MKRLTAGMCANNQNREGEMLLFDARTWRNARICLTIAAAVIAAPLPHSAVAQEDFGVSGYRVDELFDPARWKGSEEFDGITVLSRPSTVEGASEAVVVTRLEASTAVVLAALLDVSQFCVWVANCVDATLIQKTSEDRFTYRMRLAFPFPLIDRYSVVNVSVLHANGGETFVYGLTADRDQGAPTSGVVTRMRRSDGVWRLREVQNGVELSIYFAVNPGGVIPRWAMERFIGRNAAATARKLKEHLQAQN